MKFTRDDLRHALREACRLSQYNGDVELPSGVAQEFANLIAVAATEQASKTRSMAPRKLPQVVTGGLLDEQQFCFEKGWREGQAALRKAIRCKTYNVELTVAARPYRAASSDRMERG